MKKLFVVTLLLSMASFVWGQTGVKPKAATTTKPAAKPVTKSTVKPVAKPVAQPAIKNTSDSVSYAIGMGLANNAKRNNIKISNPFLSKAINDLMTGKKLVIDEPKCQTIADNALQQPGAYTSKASIDSLSYAIGVSLASFYKTAGISKINTTVLCAAVNDVMTDKKLAIDGPNSTQLMNRVFTQMEMEKSKPAIDSGIAYLERNKKRPEVKTTASGLQYEVIKEGTGIKPAAVDSVTVNYKGTLIDGSEFDNSYKRGEPITFALNQVIRGWTEGLQLMTVGSTYMLYIPYTLGYGPFGHGQIPGGATLVFQVELLDVKKAVAQ